MKDDFATVWGGGLDPAAGKTLQRQLHTKIRTSILDGKLAGGTRLPASRMLASRLGVARITVVQAYDQLVAEGYLETRTGAGTFVASGTPDQLTQTTSRSPANNDFIAVQAQHTLLSGMPALDQFPTAIWSRTTSRAMRKLNTDLMYHSNVMGYLPLRSNIASYLQASRSVVCDASQIMIVTGLQQGLFLLAKSVLQPKAPIILEDPGYDGMLASANASNHPVRYTSVDDHGALPPKEAQGLLVTSPSRQYPLGHTMPHSRRLELLAWARRTNSLIFEDDYDSEFRYAGHPLNSLQGIDGGERVIYGGTFSKSLFPALRLGYLVLPKHMIQQVTRFRSATDSFPSISGQIALNAFMEDGDFTRHIRRLRMIHAKRKNLFTNFADTHLKRFLDFQPSDAGLHLLAYSRDELLEFGLSDGKLASLAQNAGIGAVPVSNCYQFAPRRQGLLAGFANLPDETIETVVKKFARAIHTVLDTTTE